MSHPRKYDSQAIGAARFGGRSKQYVDGRPARILRRVLLQHRSDGKSLTLDFQMEIAGSNQHLAGFEPLVARGFANRQGTELIQPRGQMLRKYRRHMLNHDNGNREVGRQFGQHGSQRLRPTGRRANHHHVAALRRSVRKPWRIRRYRRGSCAGHRRRLRSRAERLDLWNQLILDALDRRGDASHVGRLGHVIGRSARQRIERRYARPARSAC